MFDFFLIAYNNDNQIYLSTFDYTQSITLIISSQLQNTTQTMYIYIFVFGIYFEQHINTFINLTINNKHRIQVMFFLFIWNISKNSNTFIHLFNKNFIL